MAAYRDPELPWTINDAIANARYPERLSFGVCWQANPEDDQWIVGLQFLSNCRIYKVLAKDSDGCCWARAITQSLWQGEEYTLQVDSHSRFAKDWDVKLLSMLAACDSPKPVLTAYPASYSFASGIDPQAVPYRIGANYFNNYGLLELQATNAVASATPVRGYFLSAGIIFGASSWMKDVPYDKALYFNGEESSLAVRLFTNGWDLFHPNEVVVYHNYGRSGAPRHQSEYTNVERELQSYARYHDIVSGKDLGKFGVGNVRTVADYQRESGVDFISQNINENSKNGVFINA